MSTIQASSLWSNRIRDYNDYQCHINKDVFYYDKPAKHRHRDHLIKKYALLFVKTRKGWRFIGHVTRVEEVDDTDKQVRLTVNRWGPERYYPNKNEILKAMGFESISDYERMHGLIPLIMKKK
jgi:hypothetical protein